MKHWMLAAFLLAEAWAGASEPARSVRTSMERPVVKTVREATAKPVPANFDLSFRGGPLKSLLEQVERTVRRKPNVIVSEEALEHRIPEFNLTGTTLENTLNAIAKIDHEVLVEKDANGNFIVVLRQKSEMRQRFYQLQKYLGKYTLEHINALIQASWELLYEENRKGERPKLRFHEETGIMIVVGTGKQIEAVDNLLKELESNEGTPVSADAGK